MFSKELEGRGKNLGKDTSVEEGYPEAAHDWFVRERGETCAAI